MGTACRNKEHRPFWRVRVRNANYSAFNGYRRTPSAYSDLECGSCGGFWRTKAAYVAEIPDVEPTRTVSLVAVIDHADRETLIPVCNTTDNACVWPLVEKHEATSKTVGQVFRPVTGPAHCITCGNSL